MALNKSEISAIRKLNKDIREASIKLTDQEARYLVDTYYQIQEFRKATANQIRSMEEEPTEVMEWLLGTLSSLETQVKNSLNAYTISHPVGKWLQSIVGIGPVISAGLLAHIDIEKAPTAGNIWSFAGLNPNAEWGKGEKRPWNAKLKTLCWKIGQSFVKVSNRPDDIYGKIYKERKEYELQKNEEGEYKDQAEYKLKHNRIKKTTVAYEWYSQGKLPPAHIQQRAERYATKIFLSHLHAFWYEQHYGEKPPKPFAISILGHAHEIKPPNMHLLDNQNEEPSEPVSVSR